MRLVHVLPYRFYRSLSFIWLFFWRQHHRHGFDFNAITLALICCRIDTTTGGPYRLLSITSSLSFSATAAGLVTNLTWPSKRSDVPDWVMSRPTDGRWTGPVNHIDPGEEEETCLPFIEIYNGKSNLKPKKTSYYFLIQSVRVTWSWRRQKERWEDGTWNWVEDQIKNGRCCERGRSRRKTRRGGKWSNHERVDKSWIKTQWHVLAPTSEWQYRRRRRDFWFSLIPNRKDQEISIWRGATHQTQKTKWHRV